MGFEKEWNTKTKLALLMLILQVLNHNSHCMLRDNLVTVDFSMTGIILFKFIQI